MAKAKKAVVTATAIGHQKPAIDQTKARFRIEAKRSPIHRWGVFAMERIPARRRVIEYTGEPVTNEEAKNRTGRRLLYIFSIGKTRMIDGAVNGSGAEFINHSCDPNLYSYEENGRIYLTSSRRIEPGEELTYDYHVKDNEHHVPCKCGAKKCRGTIGQ
jgi:uncharacterized protein